MKNSNIVLVLVSWLVVVTECGHTHNNSQEETPPEIAAEDEQNRKWGSGSEELLLENSTDWSPAMGKMINLPVEQCDTKDSVNQTDFAELLYLNMFPPCEQTYKTGYCGIRRHQNFTLISKWATKVYNQQLRAKVHLVDKHFGFETAVWPEFAVCQQFFNITCPQDQGIVHSHVFSEIPKEIPPLAAIVRVRLVSVNENNEKNVAICRQIKLHVI